MHSIMQPGKELTLQDFEMKAFKLLSPGSLAYFKSGADEECNIKECRAAWQRYILRPRLLRSVQSRDLRTSLLGHTVDMPIGIAPTAFHILANPEAECATVRAAVKSGVVMTLSNAANRSPEEVWKAARECTGSNCLLWYQIFILKDRSRTEATIRRVEKLGYQALVVTVDAPLAGNRIATARHPLCLPTEFRVPAIVNDVELAAVRTSRDLLQIMGDANDSNLTWEDIRWLSRATWLPVVAKGILSGGDAERALEAGCRAVWVSSHGGRQLDCCPAPVDVLSEVVRRVSGRGAEVYVDGGVRCGRDVVKALLLGATCAFVGRPIIDGLVCAGEVGVSAVLDVLRRELDLNMGLLGVNTVGELAAQAGDKKPIDHRSEIFAKM